MIFLLTITVVLSALCAIAILLKNRQPLTLNNQKELEPPRFRSLFEPDEEELRRFEREEKTRALETERANERRIEAEQNERIREFRQKWRGAPDLRNTLDLLELAARSKSGAIFAEISFEIIEFSNENRLNKVSKKDLAELLDSHFRTLPQQERTSGAIFRLREEIKELGRQKSEVQP